jgi:CheY-like chemotaxis protein
MPTALIVEDEPEANKLLALLVQLRGYRTVSAFNGREALAKVDREPPDIVFLDLMLPDVSGYEVCKSIKSRKATACIPVVMVTARVAVENRVRSYALGAERYVAKPYTPDQIYDALEEAEGWRLDDAGPGPSGTIRFTPADEGEGLRQVARFRSELLSRTPLDSEAVGAIGEALGRLLERADAWGRARGCDPVASVDYRTFPDRVELRLGELPGGRGWLTGDPRPPEDRWPDALGGAGFDEITVAPGGDPITFVKRLAPDASSGGHG